MGSEDMAPSTRAHARGIGGPLWPVPVAGTMLFLALMLAYPLMLGLRNYGIARDTGAAVTNAYLQLDLSWMHMLSDVFAGAYGAWLACRVYRPASMIVPPWRNARVGRYAAPMAKAGLISAASYPLACLPAISKTMRVASGPFPWYPLMGGMVVLFASCCLGYALGLIMGSRWSVAVAALVLSPLCAGGVFVVRPGTPDGGTFPRTWGGALSLVLPVSDTGVGAEPGLHMTSSGFIVRVAFFLAFAVLCLAACMLAARSTLRGRRTAGAKALCSLAALSVAMGGLVALGGPEPWARSDPFDPVCRNVDGSGVFVCSHPDDGVHLRRYVGYVRSALAWMPVHDRAADGTNPSRRLYLLLGNSFTPTRGEGRWNLTARGEDMLSGGDAVEVMTDTATKRNSRYSDLSAVMGLVVAHYFPAPCAADARDTVMRQGSLRDGRDVTAFILAQLPTTMREDAYGRAGSGLPGAGLYNFDGTRDASIRALGAAGDASIRGLLTRDSRSIETCSLTPRQAAADVARPAGE